MTFGMPCVTSYNTAMMDYGSLSALTFMHASELANDGQFFHGNRGMWMSINPDQLSKTLDNFVNNHSILTDPTLAALKGGGAVGYTEVKNNANTLGWTSWSDIGRDLYTFVQEADYNTKQKNGR